MREANRLGDINELSAIIPVDTDEDAAAGDNQVQVAISVDVSEGAGSVTVQLMDAEGGSHVLKREQGRVLRIDGRFGHGEHNTARHGWKCAFDVVERHG